MKNEQIRLQDNSLAEFFRLRNLLTMVVVMFLVGLANFIAAPSASAATKTWTGTVCNVDAPATPDCNFSTASNWGGAAPVSGDSLVFNAAEMIEGPIVNDIQDLSVNSLSVVGNPTNYVGWIQLDKELTIAGTDSGVTFEGDNVGSIDAPDASGLSIHGNIKLGSAAFVTMQYIGEDSLDIININGHALLIPNGVGPDGNKSSVIKSSITGSGTVIFSYLTNADASYKLSGDNTYSGSTIVSGGYVSNDFSLNNLMFGTSSVFISNGASVTFEYTEDKTVNNAITVEGVQNGAQLVSLGFESSLTNGVTITVPNITLNGSTRFSNTSITDLTVDITGITANGNCIEYLGRGTDALDGLSSGFVGGPAGCVLTEDSAGDTLITAPNTAFGINLASPIAVVVAMLAVIGAGIGIMRLRKQQ